MDKKNIAILILPDVQLLDVAGPTDVFHTANEILKKVGYGAPYQLHYLSALKSETVTSNSGIKLQCDASIFNITTPIDTLIIAGTHPNLFENLDETAYTWLKQIYPQVNRLASICVGTFLMAKSGLLKNKTVTTHWKYAGLLKSMYPEIHVDARSIFLKDGNIYSSGGITSGINLALHLVEEDVGRDITIQVAKHLVFGVHRLSDQSLFSEELPAVENMSELVQKVYHYANARIGETLNLEQLASAVNMSPRNFSRVFKKETCFPPGQFIEKIRLEKAKQLLAYTADTLTIISVQCGYDQVSSLNKLFYKYYKISAIQYRKTFQH